MHWFWPQSCHGLGHIGIIGSSKIHGCSNAGWPHDVWEYAPNAIVFASLVWLYFLRYWSPGKSKYHKLRCGIRMNWNDFDDLSDEFRMWKGMILTFFLPFFWVFGPYSQFWRFACASEFKLCGLHQFLRHPILIHTHNPKLPNPHATGLTLPISVWYHKSINHKSI